MQKHQINCHYIDQESLTAFENDFTKEMHWISQLTRNSFSQSHSSNDHWSLRIQDQDPHPLYLWGWAGQPSIIMKNPFMPSSER